MLPFVIKFYSKGREYMSKNQTWTELCTYIKKEILQYDDTMKFPKYLALRLKGLSEGKFIANKNTKSQGEYSFRTILYTCQIVRPKILNYFSQNSAKIKDERHKINLIMMFVEQEINNVSLRMKQTEEVHKKIQGIDFPDVKKAEYKRESKVENKNLKDLW